VNDYDRFVIKSGCLLPALRRTIRDSQSQAPIDLTSYDVTFSLKQATETGVTVLIDEEEAIVVDAANGIVEYVWGAGDTDNAGFCMGVFYLTNIDGKKFAYPQENFIEVEIEDF